MALSVPNESPERLTYEQYMAEGEVFARYDILDGVRIVTNPTRRHQRILFNLATLLTQYGTTSGRGIMIIAPCDILIRRAPLRTRQPDVLFMGNDRLARNGPDTDPAPLSPAPELVVEILSPSDTRAVLADKLADYRSVDVLECWVVSPGERTVEVLRLTAEEEESVGIYGEGQTLRSVAFPELALAVTEVFTEQAPIGTVN